MSQNQKSLSRLSAALTLALSVVLPTAAFDGPGQLDAVEASLHAILQGQAEGPSAVAGAPVAPQDKPALTFSYDYATLEYLEVRKGGVQTFRAEETHVFQRTSEGGPSSARRIAQQLAINKAFEMAFAAGVDRQRCVEPDAGVCEVAAAGCSDSGYLTGFRAGATCYAVVKAKIEQRIEPRRNASAMAPSLGAGQCATEVGAELQSVFAENPRLFVASGLKQATVRLTQLSGLIAKASGHSLQPKVSKEGTAVVIELPYRSETNECRKPSPKDYRQAVYQGYLDKNLDRILTLAVEHGIRYQYDGKDQTALYQLVNFVLAYQAALEREPLAFSPSLKVRVYRDRGCLLQDRERPTLSKKDGATLLYLEYAAHSDSLDLVPVEEIRDVLLAKARK